MVGIECEQSAGGLKRNKGGESVHHRVILPGRRLGKFQKGKAAFINFANAFKRFVAGKAQKFLIPVQLRFIIQRIGADDFNQSFFIHEGSQDQKHKPAFIARAAPVRQAFGFIQFKSAITTGKNGKILGAQARKKFGNMNFGNGAEQGKIEKIRRDTLGKGMKVFLESKRFAVLMVDFQIPLVHVAGVGRAFAGHDDIFFIIQNRRRPQDKSQNSRNGNMAVVNGVRLIEL